MQKKKEKIIKTNNGENLSSYKFELKKSLTDEEFNECFDFMKTYLIELYGESAISDENFQIWKLNRQEKDNRFFIKISKQDTTCGYAEIMILENEILYFCDIIIREEIRRTRVVYEFVKYVLNLQEFQDFDEIYLHINHDNKTSFNAWAHLGLIEIDVGEKSNKYKIQRENIEKFFRRERDTYDKKSC